METFKQVLSLVISVIGVISAIIPLYARHVDKKKKASRMERRSHHRLRSARPRVTVPPSAPAEPQAWQPELADSGQEDDPHPQDEVLEVVPAAADSLPLEKIRSLVKAPAIALLAVGFLGLFFNLLVAGYGFVDAFITPLSSDNSYGAQAGASPSGWNQRTSTADQPTPASERSTKILTIFTLLSLSLACGMAIWAGFNMLHLKSYRLSMAGCLAVMPGTIFCCAAGMPIGIWALVILLKPEVRSAFA